MHRILPTAAIAAIVSAPIALLAASVAVGDPGSPWETLKTQFATAADGAVIVLGTDITGTVGEQLAVPGGSAVTLDLAGHSLTVDASSTTGAAGIRVEAGSSLTIEDSSPGGTGHLVARGGLTSLSNGGAGIGANGPPPGATSPFIGGDVTVTRGTVEADGGYQAAGIGGANFPGGTFRITGGTVLARGGYTGTGVGGGWSAAGNGAGAVVLEGGSLTAVGGGGYPAIGGTATGTLTVAGTLFGNQYQGADTLVIPTIVTLGGPVRYTAAASDAWFRLDFGQVMSFDSQQGSDVPAQFVAQGGMPVSPAAPQRDGYDFTGWYADTAATEPYGFDAPLTADQTVFAGWSEHARPTPTPRPTPTSTPPPVSPTPTATSQTDPDQPRPTARPVPRGTPTAPAEPVTTPQGPVVTAGAMPGTSPTRRPPSPPPVPPADSTSATVAAAATAAGEPRNDGAAPSALTNSLRSPLDVLSDPGSLLAATVGLVWILVLLMTIRWLGENLKHRYDRWTTALARRMPRTAAALRGLAARSVNGSSATHIVVSVVAGAVVMLFIDPDVGLDLVSARLLLSSVIAVGATTLLTRVAAGAIARRAWGVRTQLRASGWALLVAALGVLLSRILHFVPGLLEGSALHLRPGRGEREDRMVRVEVVRGWLGVVVGLVGWVASDLIPEEGSAPTLLFHDAAIEVTAGAIGGLLIDLLPLPALVGHMLWHQARRSWVALSTVTGALFAAVIVPSAENWLLVDNGVGRWVFIATTFILAALLVIGWINVRTARENARTPGLAEPD